MSEPEIARRCLSCGASVRQRAAFCPQCGEALDNEEVSDNEQSHLHLAEEATAVDEQQLSGADDGSPPPDDPVITRRLIVRHDTPPEQTQVDEVKAQPLIVNSTQVVETRPLATNETTDRVQQKPRPGARRTVIEDQVLGRVEKIRKVSSVMIDQAAYDPSMRFLLVAAVLFLIFVVLMILSKVIG